MSVDIYQRMVKVRYKDVDGKIRTRVEGGKIVATYRGRYTPIEKSNEQAWFLIKMYNALAYVERSKPNFINYMKRNGRAEMFLAKESDVQISKDLNLENYGSKSNYGFIISATNNMMRILKSTVKEYFATEFDRIEDSSGQVTKLITGIDKTDDYWLLEEYIQYNDKSGNYDRVISHAAALTLGKVYENEFGIPTINEVKEDDVRKQEKIIKPINLLGGSGGYSIIQNNKKKPISLL